MEQASSSKVTVEYHDPSNVFRLLSPGLLPRLPLRNLHWESHAGPLRSINSLHIDLIPAIESTSTATSSSADLSRIKSNETTSDDGFRVQNLSGEPERPDSRSGKTVGASKGRRHQIPGLRQTPYLKIFFLRCDDNETYKVTARKQIRDWIKENTPSVSSTTKLNAQENHDAFEWLIVHVVVPNTAAATQPKTASKGTTPLLEKLRADFNSTSKHAVDRVAQVRIGVNDVPYDILPRVVPAIPGSNSYTETKQEHEESWQDLISKLKTLILSSFDMRVSQYEEDIKEKDAQRALPGWNFCTFFVLKEGLARGFENVGLVEDALAGYDELSLGLDNVLRDQATQDSGPLRGGSFLPYTNDLKTKLDGIQTILMREQGLHTEDDAPIDLQSTSVRDSEDEIVLAATRKNYRELILSNDISIFDFRCYIFARQLSLLLRLANASISKEELLTKLREQRESTLQGVAARSNPSQPPDETESLSVLSEVCKRAVSFITMITSLMREDLAASQASHDDKESSAIKLAPSEMRAIDNIVLSFTFSITQQILAQTSTKSLPIPPSTLTPPSERAGQEPKTTIPEPKTMMHPARSSSLMINSSARGPPSPGIFPGGRRSSVHDQPSSAKSATFLKPGLEELAAQRAELYLISRNVLEQLGADRNWTVGWDDASNIVGGCHGRMTEISLENGATDSKSEIDTGAPFSYGMTSSLLRIALSTEDDFYRLYETLTDKALRHYTVASHMHSVQTAMADLAVLKYHQEDYAAAASYFYRMTPSYGEDGWQHIEMTMLVMYTSCLKKLGRVDEYVKVTLKLLAKSASEQRERLARKTKFIFNKTGGNRIADSTNVKGYLHELTTISKDITYDVKVPLQSFFSEVEVDNAAMFHDSKDSFSLSLKFRYLLSDDLVVDKVEVRLTSISDGLGRDITLESEESPVFSTGVVRLLVHSSVNIPAIYTVKSVVLHASKLIMSHEADGSRDRSSSFIKSPKILLFQRPKTFGVSLTSSRSIYLGRTRGLELSISSGWNDVESGELHLRAGTAGLRLQTGELTQTNGELVLERDIEPGIIKFGALSADKTVKLNIPFKTDNEVQEILVKFEVSYTTKEGTFFLADQLVLDCQLPLGVNVQDIFKDKALFSRFSISSAMPSPIRVVGSQLQSSVRFQATHGGDLSRPVTVFQKQPCTLLWKVARKPDFLQAQLQASSEGCNLPLEISYVCVDEEIEEALTAELSGALQDTPYVAYTRVIIKAVSAELKRCMTSVDLERTALLNELPTAILSKSNWSHYFTGLGKDTTRNREYSQLLTEWTQSWISSTPTIVLKHIKIDSSVLSSARSITIPVEIPSISVVHTASIILSSSKTTSSTKDISTLTATTNQVISATVKIKSTRAWDTSPFDAHSSASPAPAKELKFIYELTAPSDSWLIGGKRKGHFSLPHSRHADLPVLKYPVILIPIKEGYLPYPNVEIRPVLEDRDRDDDESIAGSVNGEHYGHDEGNTSGPGDITCETDYKDAAMLVRVISGARKVTVSLDASGPQGGAWLLESEA